jgi:thiosulfate/3-mercaptopyruvate sulfurtransferase
VRLTVPYLAAALLLAAAVVPSQRPAAESPLVSVDWLAQHLKDPKLVLLHVGTKASYERAHIPGARYAYMMDLHTWEPLALEMLPPETLRQKLAALGIGDESMVVIYSAPGGLGSATRMHLVLDHAGLPPAKILQGGLPAWIAAGHQPTSDPSSATQGRLSPLKVSGVVVDADFVKAHLGKPGYAVVDGRARSFYDGVEAGGNEPQRHKAGHIPGALSIPFNTVQGQGETLKSVEELRRIFADAGVKPGDVVVGYCHIGVQVTLVLAAARTLGHRVLLYDGSFDDWSQRGLPVEAK